MPEAAPLPVLCDTAVLRNIVVLCEAAAVTAETPVCVERDGAASAVFLVGARHYVTQDACTHGPGSLAEGYVDGDEIECRSTKGASESPPANPPRLPAPSRCACGRRG